MSPSAKLNPKELARRLTTRRAELRLEQGEVAERAKLSRAYISRLENGLVSNPKLFDLEQIASALDVSLPDLVDPDQAGSDERRADLAARILGVLGPERTHCLADIMREIEGWPERDQDAVIGVIRAAVFSGVWGKRAPENQ